MSTKDLWASASPGCEVLQPDHLSHHLEPVRRYLEHAVAPGTRLAGAVRARMHGEIKLQRWLPFRAEQVIVWRRGFIWRASVRMFGLPVWGSDRLIDGQGAMRWKMLGLIPVMVADGPDVTRSAADRLAAEVVWLPSALCRADVSWTAVDETHLEARYMVGEQPAQLALKIAEDGRLQSASLSRWGNPEGADFRHERFGAVVEDERTFEGYTVPTQIRVGWYFGSDRFESDGVFFRATVDEVTYR